MKKYLLYLLIMVLGIHGFAQENGRPNLAMIESLKVAYITKELNLTPEEAQKFWPVHNNYFDELKKVRRENMDNELVFEEKALSVRKKYSTEFRKILGSDDRVNKVYTAERGFNSMMRKELLKRRMNKPNKYN